MGKMAAENKSGGSEGPTEGNVPAGKDNAISAKQTTGDVAIYIAIAIAAIVGIAVVLYFLAFKKK